MIGAAEEVEGTVRRRVLADGPAGVVPGLLHAPATSATGLPVVLLGHGGGGGKDDPKWQAVARFLALEVPAAVLCIDGPFHGERAPHDGEAAAQGRLIRRALADDATVWDFTGDWRAALGEATSIDGLRPRDLGYVGFSMGTMLGVPVCAELGVRAAVFGVGGVFGPEVMRFVEGTDPAMVAQEEQQFRRRGEMVVEGASRLAGVEVLQLAMTQDEVFSVDGALAMFAALPGPKRIVAWEGGHTELPREALDLTAWFLSRALNGPGTNLADKIGAF